MEFIDKLISGSFDTFGLILNELAPFFMAILCISAVILVLFSRIIAIILRERRIRRSRVKKITHVVEVEPSTISVDKASGILHVIDVDGEYLLIPLKNSEVSEKLMSTIDSKIYFPESEFAIRDKFPTSIVNTDVYQNRNIGKANQLFVSIKLSDTPKILFDELKSAISNSSKFYSPTESTEELTNSVLSTQDAYSEAVVTGLVLNPGDYDLTILVNNRPENYRIRVPEINDAFRIDIKNLVGAISANVLHAPYESLPEKEAVQASYIL